MPKKTSLCGRVPGGRFGSKVRGPMICLSNECRSILNNYYSDCRRISSSVANLSSFLTIRYSTRGWVCTSYVSRSLCFNTADTGRYLQTVSLCLFFFNLLPIRSLDGGKILNAFLEYVLSVDIPGSSQRIPLRRGDMDLEMGEREWNNHPLAWRRTVQRIEAVAEAMTVALVGVVFVGGILELGVG